MENGLERAYSLHANIKDRLRQAILGRIDMDIAEIRCDARCSLGQWIYGQGEQMYGTLGEFQYFKEAHADFHQAAYDTALIFQAGKIEDAMNSIENGLFKTSSATFISAITKLKMAVSDK